MRSFIDPGRLRTELVLEAASLTPDGAGGYSESWGEVALLFALLEPLRANRRFAAAQFLEEVSHRATLRFRSDVTAGMRMRKGNRVFRIITVHDPDETGRFLVCLMQEDLQ